MDVRLLHEYQARCDKITKARGTQRASDDALWFLLEIQIEMLHSLHHIERMERHIMVDETKIQQDFTGFSTDLDEIVAGITALKAAQAAGNDAAVQAEIDKLETTAGTLAGRARDAASQFDPAAPAAAKHSKR